MTRERKEDFVEHGRAGGRSLLCSLQELSAPCFAGCIGYFGHEDVVLLLEVKVDGGVVEAVLNVSDQGIEQFIAAHRTVGVS